MQTDRGASRCASAQAAAATPAEAHAHGDQREGHRVVAFAVRRRAATICRHRRRRWLAGSDVGLHPADTLGRGGRERVEEASLRAEVRPLAAADGGVGGGVGASRGRLADHREGKDSLGGLDLLAPPLEAHRGAQRARERRGPDLREAREGHRCPLPPDAIAERPQVPVDHGHPQIAHLHRPEHDRERTGDPRRPDDLAIVQIDQKAALARDREEGDGAARDDARHQARDRERQHERAHARLGLGQEERRPGRSAGADQPAAGGSGNRVEHTRVWSRVACLRAHRRLRRGHRQHPRRGGRLPQREEPGVRPHDVDHRLVPLPRRERAPRLPDVEPSAGDGCEQSTARRQHRVFRAPGRGTDERERTGALPLREAVRQRDERRCAPIGRREHVDRGGRGAVRRRSGARTRDRQARGDRDSRARRCPNQ